MKINQKGFASIVVIALIPLLMVGIAAVVEISNYMYMSLKADTLVDLAAHSAANAYGEFFKQIRKDYCNEYFKDALDKHLKGENLCKVPEKAEELSIPLNIYINDCKNAEESTDFCSKYQEKYFNLSDEIDDVANKMRSDAIIEAKLAGDNIFRVAKEEFGKVASMTHEITEEDLTDPDNKKIVVGAQFTADLTTTYVPVGVLGKLFEGKNRQIDANWKSVWKIDESK